MPGSRKNANGRGDNLGKQLDGQQRSGAERIWLVFWGFNCWFLGLPFFDCCCLGLGSFVLFHDRVSPTNPHCPHPPILLSQGLKCSTARVRHHSWLGQLFRNIPLPFSLPFISPSIKAKPPLWLYRGPCGCMVASDQTQTPNFVNRVFRKVKYMHHVPSSGCWRSNNRKHQ